MLVLRSIFTAEKQPSIFFIPAPEGCENVLTVKKNVITSSNDIFFVVKSLTPFDFGVSAEKVLTARETNGRIDIINLFICYGL